MKRAAIYSRVSTEDQEDNSSLGTQEASCRAYAAAHGYVVVESLVMREQHSGADLWNRPKLGIIRDAMKRGEVDAVIFHKLDRLTRHQNHLGVILDECERFGTKLECATERIDQTIIGGFVLQAMALSAALEREAIRERSLRGKRARASSGKVLNSGVDLYGYTRDREAGRYVPRADEAEVVRRIYEWCADGESISRISARLLREGVPAPGVRSGMGVGRWGDSTLSRILHDTRYKGEGYAFTSTSVTVPGVGKRNRPAPLENRIKLPAEATPALVSVELWDEVQARLRKVAPHRTRNEKRPKLLRGYVKCAVCGGTMTPQGTGRNGKRYYRCTSYMRPGERCGAKMAREEKLDAWVWNELSEIINDPRNVLAMLAEVGMGSGESAGLVKERDAAKAALAKLDGQAAKLVELLMGDDDALPLDVVKAKLAGIETQRKAAAARVDETEAAMAEGKRRTADVVSFMATVDRVKANLRNADFDTKRLTIEALVDRVFAGTDPAEWRIELALPMVVDGIPSRKHWGTEHQPPAISAALVASLAHPDFLVEIEAIAIVSK